jgi:hypothetical protein
LRGVFLKIFTVILVTAFALALLCCFLPDRNGDDDE